MAVAAQNNMPAAGIVRSAIELLPPRYFKDDTNPPPRHVTATRGKLHQWFLAAGELQLYDVSSDSNLAALQVRAPAHCIPSVFS